MLLHKYSCACLVIAHFRIHVWTYIFVQFLLLQLGKDYIEQIVLQKMICCPQKISSCSAPPTPP